MTFGIGTFNLWGLNTEFFHLPAFKSDLGVLKQTRVIIPVQ